MRKVLAVLLFALPAFGQTVVSVDNLGNIVSTGNLSAVSVVTLAGVASGTYVSGLGVSSGGLGDYCNLTFPSPGGGGTAPPPPST